MAPRFARPPHHGSKGACSSVSWLSHAANHAFSACWMHGNGQILGWGVPWKGLSQKLQASWDAVKDLDPDCIIMFSDAFDVLFTSSMADIKQKVGASLLLLPLFHPLSPCFKFSSGPSP